MMKNTFYILTAVVAMCFASCEKYDHAISDFEDRLDKTEDTSIATIEQQLKGMEASIDDLKAVDTALDNYIRSLETVTADLKKQLKENSSADAATKADLQSKIDKINTLIAELQAKDAELEQLCLDVEQIVYDEIAATEEWVNFTFATLEQYEALQAELEGVKLDIQDINDAIANLEITLGDKIATDIETAITDLEDGMKEWVYETLAESYYDMAAIDAKLQDLADEAASDEELQAAIDKQTAALVQAKTDLTAAYQDAIKAAINENNGVITQAIATAINDAKRELESQINDIENRIDDLETKINDIAGRIQSLTFLPRYSDGMVKMDYNTKSTTLDFIVSPAALAHTIETAFNKESSTIKAFVSYTEDPTTRAILGPIQQIVEKIEVVGNDGMFTLTIKEQGLDDNEFWQGMKEAVIYIHISTGSSNFVSNTIPMIAYSYVGDTNNINSFGDGNDWRVPFTE